MRPDTFTNTPEDAAAYERIRGADEAIDHESPVHRGGKYCSVCQNAPLSGYVCGPCERDAS